MPRQKFLNKLDRADLPARTKQSLELSLRAFFSGYDDDGDDPTRIDPNARSLDRLLEFLSHPYHRLWVPPALSINGQGMFAAVWNEPDVYRWVLEFHPDGDIEETYLELDTDRGVTDTSRKSRVGDTVWPPFPEAKIR